MFRPIIKASRSRKFWMRAKAEEVAEENGWEFTGSLEANSPSAYAAEFVSADSDDPFYGWAIIKEDGYDTEDFDFAFGSGQMVFNGDYVITDEDYFDIIGAGI